MLVEVTRSISQKGIDVLKEAGLDLRIGADGLAREELLNFFSGQADAVIVNGHFRVDNEYLDAVGLSVRILANHGVGYDHFDLEAIRCRSIIVTNTPGVLTQAVAEHTLGLMIGIIRDIPEADRVARTESPEAKANIPTAMELKGKTLGILGLGRIGSRVAHFCSVIGMEVIYHDLIRNPEIETSLNASFVPTVEELMLQSDVLSIHLPLDESTRRIVNASRLALMKNSSYLINTSRGEVVDEGALTEVLQEGMIAGAALDVGEAEPKWAEGLKNLENVILTPHMAYRTAQGREGMAELAALNVVAVLSGKVPLTPIT